MARKLKTFVTSLGFFDQAIAVPSMKAALEAWGADSNLFHQGAAKETDDPAVIAATMAKPGVVLKRPVGSDGPFGEHAGLPADLGRGGKTARPAPRKPAKHPRRLADTAAEREAALAYDREQKRCARDRAKEEATALKESKRRQRAVDSAQAALDAAEGEHAARHDAIDAERETLDKKAEEEDARWDKQRARLQTALKRARSGSP